MTQKLKRWLKKLFKTSGPVGRKSNMTTRQTLSIQRTQILTLVMMSPKKQTETVNLYVTERNINYFLLI